MPKYTQKQIGSLGEEVAARHLLEKGFELVIFGRDEKLSSSELINKLPQHHNYWIGSSRANLGELQSTYNNLWIEGNLPKWADLSDGTIDQLTSACKESSKCTMRDSNKKKAPCASGTRIFERSNLAKTYPQGVSILKADGIEQKRSAMHFAYNCSNRFSELLSSDYLGEIVPLGEFMRDNQLISGYIQKTYEKYAASDMKLPYSGDDIRKAGMTTPKAEEMKDANRAYLNAQKKSFPEGHPGRYDFIAKDSSGITAVEVKVNTSKMSYWQELRFKLLKEMGHKTMLIKISGKPEALEEYCSHGNSEGVTIDCIKNPSVEAVELEGYAFSDVMRLVPRNRIYF